MTLYTIVHAAIGPARVYWTGTVWSTDRREAALFTSMSAGIMDALARQFPDYHVIPVVA